ncbi:hypothetical protein SLEP1_g34820 [Rubroshorea leprosula]|uniref:Uncharacterized protein n=1 Tax=Rubroshorea leprosula TaxID=152421 RepID=A0AAV5KL89_9ROSI|nr:hypothetical protein SLEP1_g34820 [Rubroshorea leprosula]
MLIWEMLNTIVNPPLAYLQAFEFNLQNTGQKDYALDPSFCDPFTGCMFVFDVAQFDRNRILKMITVLNNALLSDPVSGFFNPCSYTIFLSLV